MANAPLNVRAGAASFWELCATFPAHCASSLGPPATGRNADHRQEVLGDLVRTAYFDADQLETLMVAAFELMGKPEAQAGELALSILRATERPQSGDPAPQDRARRGAAYDF